ncbi:MAG: hypothetical protein HKO53_01375 [Gemmatimonadetes bacterium]|nr:hypothetical protein [Gemmatimonadota bacterium]
MTTEPPTGLVRLLAPYKDPRKRWQQFWKDCGRRGALPEEGVHMQVPQGVAWAHPRSCFYWELGWKGEVRYCKACGRDLGKGECSVRRSGSSPTYHVRCVTPEQWRYWLGAPAAGSPPFEKTPTRTDKTFEDAIDEGWLTLAPGVSVSEAVDAVRKRAGQPPARRKETPR